MSDELNTIETLMVVSDNPAIPKQLSLLLPEPQYRLLAVTRGDMALQEAEQAKPSLILLDTSLPDISGYEVCAKLKAHSGLKDIPVIFIYPLESVIDKSRGYAAGGADYLATPLQIEEVISRIETQLKLRRIQQDLKTYREQISAMTDAHHELTHAQLATIAAISKIAEARDNDKGKHIERIQEYCRALAFKISEMPQVREDLSQTFVNDIFYSCPLHDIGKVAIPDKILLKPGKLDNDEFEVIKTHTLIGYDNLQAVAERYPDNVFINMGIEIARSHHEHWDGSGYPDGLSGDQIPLPAQIMALADVYDALRSERVYKKAVPHDQSREIIREVIGKHFSPIVGEAFLALNEEFFNISELLQDESTPEAPAASSPAL